MDSHLETFARYFTVLCLIVMAVLGTMVARSEYVTANTLKTKLALTFAWTITIVACFLILSGCAPKEGLMPAGKVVTDPPQWTEYCKRNPTDEDCKK